MVRTKLAAVAVSWIVLVAPLPVAAQGAPAGAFLLENLRVNRDGLVQVDLRLRQPPAPRGGLVLVEFSYGDDMAPYKEVVRGSGVTINARRVYTTQQPFPCDQTLPVTVRVVDPAGSNSAATAELSRACTKRQGTPNLVPVGLVRFNGGLDSPPDTPIRVRVTVKNDSPFDMPWNEQGGTPWGIQVQRMSPALNPHMVRRALQAGQEYTFETVLAVPCGRETPVEVWVDVRNVIRESDKADNKKTFNVAGNKCMDAG